MEIFEEEEKWLWDHKTIFWRPLYGKTNNFLYFLVVQGVTPPPPLLSSPTTKINFFLYALLPGSVVGVVQVENTAGSFDHRIFLKKRNVCQYDSTKQSTLSNNPYLRHNLKKLTLRAFADRLFNPPNSISRHINIGICQFVAFVMLGFKPFWVGNSKLRFNVLWPVLQVDENVLQA